MFERLKSALTPWLMWFSTFSLPARFIIGAVVSAVTSAGAVGAITKLGAYWFVLYYGVRTPADGLPYVAETAAMFSVLLLVAAALSFSLAYAYFSLVSLLLRAVGRPEPDKTVPLLRRFHFQVGLIGLVATFVLLLTFVNSMGVENAPWRSLVGYIVILASLILASDVGVGKAALGMCAATVLTSFVLWLPPTYGWFLRTIGHGGGRYCTVHLSGEQFPRQIKGYLVVRTGTALLMFDGKEETIEIPLEHVLRIEQPTKVYWCLPGNCTPAKTVP